MYDLIYELTQVAQGTTTTETYTYDAVGNRLSSLGVSPYDYNPSNELTSKPSVTYTYDNNGNTNTVASGSEDDQALEAAESEFNFWRSILYGDAALGVVGTGGALGGLSPAAGGGILIPVPTP